MALDTTVGGASADSYITVAEADAYAEADLGPEAQKWRHHTTLVPHREAALKRATREIDALLRPTSTPYATTQRLAFPRATDIDSLDAPYIQRAVKEATYYQAAFVLSNAALIDRASARQARNLSQANEQGANYTIARDDESTIYSQRARNLLAAYATATSARGGMTAIYGDTGMTDLGSYPVVIE